MVNGGAAAVPFRAAWNPGSNPPPPAMERVSWNGARPNPSSIVPELVPRDPTRGMCQNTGGEGVSAPPLPWWLCFLFP